jgi:hypothetical protein
VCVCVCGEGGISGMTMKSESKAVGEMPLCLPQIPHEVTWGRNRAPRLEPGDYLPERRRGIVTILISECAGLYQLLGIIVISR